MNCKPGDLAVFVRSAAGNEGVIVEVISPLGVRPLFDGARWGSGGFCWLVRSIGRPIRSSYGFVYMEAPARDEFLRPIRDQDGEDETLTWAGKPEGVTA